MAKKGLDEIGGQKVEKWLDLLNHDSPYTLAADDTVVVRYKGEDLFFIDGTIGCRLGGPPNYICLSRVSFLQSASHAVKLLSEQEQLFGKIAGSSDLAAFGVRQVFRFCGYTDVREETGGLRRSPRNDHASSKRSVRSESPRTQPSPRFQCGRWQSVPLFHAHRSSGKGRSIC